MQLVESNIKQSYKMLFSNMVYDHFIHISNIPELGHNIKEIKTILESETLKMLLLFNNSSKLVGYLISEVKLVPDGRYVLYINYIYIKPEYRKNGFGQTMINRMISYCKKNDIKFIMLTFDTKDLKLSKFYKKIGFEKDQFIHTNYNGNQVFTFSL